MSKSQLTQPKPQHFNPTTFIQNFLNFPYPHKLTQPNQQHIIIQYPNHLHPAFQSQLFLINFTKNKFYTIHSIFDITYTYHSSPEIFPLNNSKKYHKLLNYLIQNNI